MPDKQITYGSDAVDARYRGGDDDPAGGGNYVVAERLDENGDSVDVLLEWDETAGEWVSGGPVNLDGNDVTNVGALDADSVSTDEISRNVGMQSVTIYRDPDTDEAVAVAPDGLEIARQSGTARIGPVIESVLTSEGGRTHIFVEDAFYSINDGDAITGISWPSRVTIEFAAGAQISVTEPLTNSVGDDSLSCIFDVRLSGGTVNNVQFIGHRSTIDCAGNVDIPFYFASGQKQHLRDFEIQSPSVSGWRVTLEEGSGVEFNKVENVDVVDPDTVDPNWNGQFIRGTDARCVDCSGPGLSGWLFRDVGKIRTDGLVWVDKAGQTDGLVLESDAGPSVNGNIGQIVAEGDSDPRSVVRVNGLDGNVTRLGGGPVVINNAGADTSAVQLNDNGTGTFGQTIWDIQTPDADGVNNTTSIDVVNGSPAVGTRANIIHDGSASVFQIASSVTGVAVLNNQAREAAGTGNSPSLDWPYGVQVENVDDNTIWTKDQSNGWVQLG